MISFELSEELAMIQRTAVDFAAAEIRPQHRRAEQDGAVGAELASSYLDLGFGLTELPERVGGLGLGLVGRVVVEEAIAHGDIGIALALPTPGAFAQVVLTLGTEAQSERFIGSLIESQGPGAIAWNDGKPSPGGFAASAEEQPDGSWRLNGLKTQVLGADTAPLMVMFAEARRLDGDTHPAAFVIDTKSEGVRVGPPVMGLGLGAAPVRDVTFEHVHVSADDRLSGADDRFGAATVEAVTRAGVLGAARAVGVASAAFDLAREFAEERTAFGKPIAHFQGLAFLIADMATTVEVMRTVARRAAWAFDVGEDDAVKQAAMAIAECHEGAMFVTNNTVQVMGGSGFIRDYPAEKWMRDAKAHMAYAMPHQLCDLVVGRLGLDGDALRLDDDAPMPAIQSVMI